MGILEVSRKLKAKAVWATEELASMLGVKRNSAKVMAQRLFHKGLLFRAGRGLYASTENPMAIASALEKNSYISFVAALQMRGASMQVPSIIQAVAMKKTARRIDGVEWVVFPAKKIFGFEKTSVEGYAANVAETEKAIADIAYRPRAAALSYAYAALSESSPQKVLKYAKIMGMAAYKRAGYMMEKAGMEVPAKPEVSGVHKLNPANGEKGKFNAKWRIYVNEAL